MDNNNIGGMNPQQFSQNTPQTSQPHMGVSGIELQKMQQEAEQRRREQSRRNADFFGRLCIPTIIYALLYTIFLYENTGGILVTLFAIVTGVYSLYCMKILHIEAKPLTIWYSVMMILTGLSSGLNGNKMCIRDRYRSAFESTVKAIQDKWADTPVVYVAVHKLGSREMCIRDRCSRMRIRSFRSNSIW